MRCRSRIAIGALFCILTASTALAQVRVTARLEKEHYLRGEPVIVTMEVVNVGDRSVYESSSCNGDVRLEIIGQSRRQAPALHGCFAGVDGIGCSSLSHVPPIAPGERKVFSFLLTQYDLPPGRFDLVVSGMPRLRWSDSQQAVPGGAASQTLLLEIRDATTEQLTEVLRPLVADAASTSPTKFDSRAALIEAAPQHLARELAQFAEEGMLNAPDALRRIGTAESVALLRGLLDSQNAAVRNATLYALAGLGRGDDVKLFATLLADATIDRSERGLAALALGKIGGDSVVPLLESAASNGPAELRRTIVTALGHTRSPLAVGAIARITDDDTRNEMCGSLRMLTHTVWCDGSLFDVDARARRWLREWSAQSPRPALHGLEDCDVLEAEDERARQEASRPARVVPEPAIRPSPESPKITSLQPPRTSAGGHLLIRGYALGARDSRSVTVRFAQGQTVQDVAVVGTGWSHKDGLEGEQYLQVIVPDSLKSGRWDLQVLYGNTIVRSSIDIVAPTRLALTRMLPSRPHPSQLVEIQSTPPPLDGDAIEVIDSKGVSWTPFSFTSSSGFGFELPPRVAPGIAIVRVRRPATNGQVVSESLTFNITTDPMPLPLTALEYMKPVAPGQFTNIWPDTSAEFEVERADRIEFEFQQGSYRVTADSLRERPTRIQIPSSLRPGVTLVRTRTWIDQTASEWSAAFKVTLLKRPAPISVSLINSTHGSVWQPGGPRFMFATPGETFVLDGSIPVAAANLKVQLERRRDVRDVNVVATREGFQFTVPIDLPRGDWRLRVGAVDGSTPTQNITLVRVE